MLQRSTLWLGGATTAILLLGSLNNGTPGDAQFQARLLPSNLRKTVPVVSIPADDIAYGTTVPADTHVIIHIPEDVTRITRSVLFGRKGFDVRYWGYCYSEEQDDNSVLQRKGVPGRMFLSEKERAIRKAEATPKPQPVRVQIQTALRNTAQSSSARKSVIQHTMEVFYAGDVCYVMTEAPLPIGADYDGDGLNTQLETTYGTNPNPPQEDGSLDGRDTDEDGLPDAIEIFSWHSNPLLRDTDGDGLIDGLEDQNFNGRLDSKETEDRDGDGALYPGDTNPLERDSDKDGLCDGYCVVRFGRGAALRGEDRNLNGIVDEGEMDPRTEDTDGDGILDEVEYLNCIEEEGSESC